MSEKAKEEGAVKKKKKGKLPIIVALVAVLAGGGYFMMKPKGGAAKPKVELGKDVADIGEVLVNLRDGSSYARVNVGLQFAKTFDTHSLEHAKTVVRDAIIETISAKTLAEVRSPEGKEQLKIEIAAAINHKLHLSHGGDAEHGDPSHKKDAKADEGHGDDHGETKHSGPAKPKHKGWHSDEGPVLIVYFADFVTQ